MLAAASGIEDERVDPDFGTGALKVTPGHDPLDFEIGRDHRLPELTVIGPDGRMNESGGELAGLTQEEAEERVLAWSHFVPAYDKWFDAFAEQFSTKNNVKIIIDHVPHLQIPAKIAAEIATQSGHDIVQLVGSGTEKWASALAEAQDVCDRLAKNAPITVRRMKETAVKSSGLPLAAALRLDEGLNPYLSEDRKEGARAYVEKREPRWQGR